MNFGFTEEQELLRKTARDFLGAHASSPQVRAIMEGPESYSEPLWRRMAELGWLGLAFPERFGGAGRARSEHGWRETEGEQQQEPGGHRRTLAEPGRRHPALTPESAI